MKVKAGSLLSSDILQQHSDCSTAVSSHRPCHDSVISVSEESAGAGPRLMPGHSPRMAPGDSMRATSRSPGSGTDADSAIGADTAETSTSPELRHETDFADEKEETFVCFGENDGGDYDQR